MSELMKTDAPRAIAMVLIGSFVIDRIVTGVLFLLSFGTTWKQLFPEPLLQTDATGRLEAEKKRKLIYFLLTAGLALLVVVNLANAHVHVFFENPFPDWILTCLVLMGASDRIAELLKMMTGAPSPEPAKAREPFEITGRLILEEPQHADKQNTPKAA